MIRSHRKTRTGCKQCKSRRVKCDEKRPFCSGCIRNELACSLEFLTPTFPSAIARRFKHPINCVARPSIFTLNHPLTTDSDFELMSHYISIACFTLGNSRDMHIWQLDIPYMALSHDFLQHGILAFSALHLSTLQPSRKKELARRASLFEQTALTPFREFVSKNDPQDIHAVFAFAGFVVPYVLALSGSLGIPSGRIPCLGDDRPHWFLILRGLVSLVDRSWTELAKGPFGPILGRQVNIVEYRWNPEDDDLARICLLLEPTEATSAEDEKVLEICQAALHVLRRVFALPYSPCKTLTVISRVYIWPGAIQHDFIELVDIRRPEALVILAYYCVILKQADSCWYLKGVGVSMLTAIERELDPAWKPWIKWALDQPVQDPD